MAYVALAALASHCQPLPESCTKSRVQGEVGDAITVVYAALAAMNPMASLY